MSLVSVNPTDDSVLAEHAAFDAQELDAALDESTAAAGPWSRCSPGERAELLRSAAALLEERQDKLARLVTTEMGKLFTESTAEVAKCAWVCRYYADQAAAFLADEAIETDGSRSYVAYQPLGTLLAVMPWNFPLWQVFRCAAPALAAGNTVLLKHAANVSLCALAIQDLFAGAGFPAGVFKTLLIGSEQVAALIADPRIQAVSLTGSVGAGRAVGRACGANLKPSVLELGGSDPFVVLEDAELEETVATAVTARFQNAGQSCIAAKRFIVVADIADRFVEAFAAAAGRLQPGDPLEEDTRLAPMARRDLRDELHEQVLDALESGAAAVVGCAPAEGSGAYYQASILDGVAPGMRAYEEELFGPVASVLRVRDEAEALAVANASRFGLGGSVWTGDAARGEAFARRMACGAAFVNGLVKSDPRLPFGGIKDSGYGRELSHHGIHEFVNVKAMWVK